MARPAYPVLKSQNPRSFLFRGNAVAAGGFVTRLGDKPVELDPNVITTNGQSCLPMIGGVSLSRVEPVLAFPKYISYGICETYVWGRYVGDTAITTLRASVADVQLNNSPSPEDRVPDVASFTFEAKRIAIEVESTHPQEGQPSFQVKALEAVEMSLTQTSLSGERTRTPVELDFDGDLLKLLTMEQLEKEFRENQDFFTQQTSRLKTRSKLVFGKSKLPRTPQGYFLGSIVKQIRYGDKVIPGNTLIQPGFGRLSFGVILAEDFSRRISMAQIKMGSDTGGDVGFTGVDTNGIWQ